MKQSIEFKVDYELECYKLKIEKDILLSENKRLKNAIAELVREDEKDTGIDERMILKSMERQRPNPNPAPPAKKGIMQ